MENFSEWASDLDVDAERPGEEPEDEVTLLRRQVADLSAKVGRLQPGGGKHPEEGPGGLKAAIDGAKTMDELEGVLERAGMLGDETHPYPTSARR